MKKWRYLCSFATTMALCVAVGLGLSLHYDSETRDGNQPPPPPKHPLITAEILIVGNVGEEQIKLQIRYGGVLSDSEVIEANHDQRIKWSCSDPRVLDYVLFFGGNSPIGEQLKPRGEVTIYTELRPESIIKSTREVEKQVFHYPRVAGGRQSKYYIAVYYQPVTGPGKVLIRDPDIIIPPRGGSGS